MVTPKFILMTTVKKNVRLLYFLAEETEASIARYKYAKTCRIAE